MTTIDETDTGDDGTGWKRDRPRMPGYGVPDAQDGMLALPDIRERLATAKNYWICTATSSGTPHAVPVWAAFVNDTLYFGVGPRSTRNLLANAAVSVHLESADRVVIAEGIAEQIHGPDPELSKAIDDQYAAKYDWRPSGDSETPVGDGWFALAPHRIIAWTSFPADATRWTRTPVRTSA